MPDFDPNSPADPDGGIFGLPLSEAEAALVLLPVPWEATTSYGGGTAGGPKAILGASGQIDLFDGEVDRPYLAGLHMPPESAQVRAWNRKARAAARKVIAVGGQVPAKGPLRRSLDEVNALSLKLDGWVERECSRLMDAGKIVGVVGGDHSVPLGAFRAAARAHGDFGLLHFDAHSDTRDAYEGFVGSHASIMRNALDSVPAAKTIVQVGIRDYCEQEDAYVRSLGARARVYSDRELSERRFAGEPFARVAEELVGHLPDKVWVSFDIDGLDPKLCPHTGTPVPGGLEFAEANRILRALALSGRTILGFDLVEVAPGDDEWDANVGMRLLYKLCAWTLHSRGLRPLKA
ncbi:MAG: agmatinase family protein [Elusimicrobia bacterium]|nr:agmatinase family protein [Elusimicrobiota bacterium]